MEAIQEAEKLLANLTRAEKAQVLELIVRELGDFHPGIEKTPGVCGGSARIVRTRIPVWTLEQYRRLGMNEAELLQAYPTLRAADLGNAWAYARARRAEIDEDIRQNEIDEDET
jgi:uncharacterized protein (DUF433 family)